MSQLRLSVHEMGELRKKSLEINRQLIEKGKAPIMDSKLLHAIFKNAIPRIKLDDTGNIILDIAG